MLVLVVALLHDNPWLARDQCRLGRNLSCACDGEVLRVGQPGYSRSKEGGAGPQGGAEAVDLLDLFGTPTDHQEAQQATAEGSSPMEGRL